MTLCENGSYMLWYIFILILGEMPFKMVIVVINHWFLFQQKLFLVQFSVLINALHIHAWVYRGINQLFLRHAIYALLLSVLFALTFKIPTWRYNLESGLHIYETNGSFGFWLWRLGLYQVCTKNSRPSFRMALTFSLFSIFIFNDHQPKASLHLPKENVQCQAQG